MEDEDMSDHLDLLNKQSLISLKHKRIYLHTQNYSSLYVLHF